MIQNDSPLQRIRVRLMDICSDLADPFVSQLLEMFLGEADLRMAQIRRAAGAGEYAALRNAAHALAGVSYNMGADSLGQTLNELEAFAVTRTGSAVELVNRVEIECGRTCNAVTVLSKTVKA